MSGSPIDAIRDSAQRAALSGDFTGAESLLREVARLQADSLGSQHPDLASTFNNLGVVCERTINLLDAGKFYRQAWSVASACLRPDDPLVITSRNNFNEFHRALGLVDTAVFPLVEVSASVRESESVRPAVFLGIVTVAALLGQLAIWWVRAPVAVEPVEQRALELGNPLEPVRPTSSQQNHSIDRPAVSESTVPTSTHAEARLIEVSLCESLSTTSSRWECTPTSDPAAGGWMYFYTRIVAPTSSRVHHRWYQNDVLRRDVSLAVQANPSAGYRTYSRQRVESGDWRVAVVDANGVVLREERVAVR